MSVTVLIAKSVLRYQRTIVGPRSVQIATPQLAAMLAESVFMARAATSTASMRRSARTPMLSATGPRS